MAGRIRLANASIASSVGRLFALSSGGFTLSRSLLILYEIVIVSWNGPFCGFSFAQAAAQIAAISFALAPPCLFGKYLEITLSPAPAPVS